MPVRTSVATWDVIINLLTPAGTSARAELEAVTSTVAMLIAEEYTSEAPIVVMPVAGSRIRIYTLHGAAAVEGEDPAALATWPLAEAGWRISLPCSAADLDEVRTALKPHPYLQVRDLTEGIVTASTEPQHGASGRILIDYSELERS
ncbi:hypothetical protein [Solwaraspora sp. WMMD792]|uniref:hypothetical protein n=1 Tax=Solwaraspora sp. WMMD792 TaxID=3016099 RepID=UPI002417D5FF|nr:hypothetical protein [Solwaraspora sp. WMMD792]MDG4769967.1 hypothetical protein [Solwaraspora sp. WMMD792]